MNRQRALDAVDDRQTWDFIVIGGGATGLGVAVDAASRGYRTLLLEQGDLGQGTSSRSTKLVHGGVRYLQQGNVALVIDALQERGLLLANAPHLVRNLSFVVPNYEWWEGPFYGIGLKMYDLLAGRHGFGRSRVLSRQRTLQLLPTLEPRGLNGGVIYYDGQFDDARLCVALARTAAEQGAAVVNYARVTGLIKEGAVVSGVRFRDQDPARSAGPANGATGMAGEEKEVRARVVINATGPWTDDVRRMDDAQVGRLVRHSQGVHLVLSRDFLPGESAIMVPRTDDGRVLFAIPWLDRVLVGTTDTPVAGASLEPVALDDEVTFLLQHAGRYLDRQPGREDVLSVFAGLRPLVGGAEGDDETATASLSRDHTLLISESGLVTITGGKWTTYRKMAEDTVDQAATLADLDDRPCVTRKLHLHGYHANAERFGELAHYGSDAPELRDLLRRDPRYAEPLHHAFPSRAGEVVWAARHEMARTVEDVLSRRTRALILDARAAVAAAPTVAALMAEELGLDRDWANGQVEEFTRLAAGYLA
jgi:glycerol-3-phosphate dehydrogenase